MEELRILYDIYDELSELREYQREHNDGYVDADIQDLTAAVDNAIHHYSEMQKRMKLSARKNIRKSKLRKSSFYYDPENPHFDTESGRWMAEGDTHVKVYQMKEPMRFNYDAPSGKFHFMISMKDFDELDESLKEAFTMDWYEFMWEGDLPAEHDPWHVYSILQDHRPIEASQAMYSLSDGDIIEMDGELLMLNPSKFIPLSSIRKSVRKGTHDVKSFNSMVKSIRKR